MALGALPYLDVEADRKGRILAIGVVRGDTSLHLALEAMSPEASREALLRLVGDRGVIAGHNLVAFDAPLLEQALGLSLGRRPLLDTLHLSLLAWPERTSHRLDKTDGAGEAHVALPDPCADARRARALALEAEAELATLEPELATLYASLLFPGRLPLALPVPDVPPPSPLDALAALAEDHLEPFCRVHLTSLLESLDPTADPGLARALALALRFIERRALRVDVGDHTEGRLHGPPSAALHAIPHFGELLALLMGPLCPDPGCAHRQRCHVHRPFAEEILARNFDLPGFRPGQKEVVAAVLGDRRPLAILPTGGGKSLCYQLPAVHGGERLHGLTVVISPLQALMADQVRALSTRYPPSCFINSSLLMEERSEHLRGLRTGKYNVLYIGPEQLRNPSMVSLLRNRPPFLWVVDEAHCISQWGHNFRTDYTYLPRAIRSIHPHGRLPLLALFTATATADVRRDIATQIREALGVEIELLDFGARRDNLRYEVVACRDGQHKMNELVAQLRASESAGGARLVYCATTRQVADCVEMLKQHGIASAMYHGQLAPADKREQLERFLSGETDCIVATSAFGMGIDKPDIRLVVHYEIPGSLEDYVQETGRAGRDGEPARCVLLFQEEDLDIQFFLKSASRITDRDLRYVFKVLRSRAKRFRRHAREDGWVDLWVGAEDLFVEESLEDKLAWSSDTLHHKLKLVLHHLEEDGVLFRLENRTRTVGIFPRLASEEAALAVLQAKAADPNPVARRVLRYLYDPERPRRVSALDIADACGIAPRRAFEQVQALTAMGIVGQDLAFEVTLAHGVAKPSKELAHQALRIADALFTIGDDLDDDPVIRIRSAAAEIGRQLGQRVPPHRLVSLLRALRRHGLLQLDKFGPDLYRVRFDPSAITARDRLRRAQRVAGALFEHLGERLGSTRGRDLVVHLDINDFVERPTLTEKIDHEETVATCLLLHHLEAWHLADPPVLFDTAMRVRVDPKATLGQVDMGRPARHHQHEIQLVHMMREYAVTQPSRRQRYVDDYFRLRGEVMAEMYFRGRKLAIQRPVSAAAEARIVEGLTPAQREAVVAEEPAVLVVAGPGSGKTHTLVRRIVHMVVARQIRADQILVLAFNRSAAAELRARLDEALGTRGSWVDVRTFHSLAVKLTSADLFDRQGDADPDARLDEAMAEAAELLAATDEDDRERATHVRNQVLGGVRHVLVDEYQDLDPSQYALLAALVGLDAKKRGLDRTERSVYVVGDDDQAIYGFRNASVEFLRRFEVEFQARRICLRDNFRSDRAIIKAAQQFIEGAPDRLKTLPDEQMCPAPGCPPARDRAVRRLRFAEHGEMATHVAFAVGRLLDESSDDSLAILGRHWSDLDPVRYLLEEAGIAVTIHHRGFKRPVHRRHPVAYLVDKLWRKRAPLLTTASELVTEELLRLGRALDEPVCRELLAIVAEIDGERARLGRLPFFGHRPPRKPAKGTQLDLLAAEDVLPYGPPPPPAAQSPLLAPMTTAELADAIVMGSRDAAWRDRTSQSDAARVHLATYHGAKGLEFDRVIVLPARRPRRDDGGEERRAFYVAMTRARRELALATRGDGDFASQIDAPTLDLRGIRQRLGTAAARYLDADPSHVRLYDRTLARNRGFITKLVEGTPLTIQETDGDVRFLADGQIVGALSQAGRARLDRLRPHGPLTARVHEIYQHYQRNDDGEVVRRWLVLLPTLHAGQRTPR